MKGGNPLKGSKGKGGGGGGAGGGAGAGSGGGPPVVQPSGRKGKNDVGIGKTKLRGKHSVGWKNAEH